MRRSILIAFAGPLALVACLAVLAVGLFSGAAYVPGPRAPLVYYVIGTDATDWRTGGPNRYLCDGTAITGGDQVELRAAVAKASAAGGGVVEMVGTLYYSDPAGETAWAGTGTVATVVNNAVITVTAWTTGDLDDVTVGEQLRLSLTDKGTDPATTNDDLVFTVSAKDAGPPETITLHTATQTATYADPGVDFTRMVAAVEVPAYVTLRGQGHARTRLRAISSATCSTIQITGNFTKLEGFDVYDAVVPDAYDHRRNGVLVPDDSLECMIRDVSVWYVKGSGFCFNEGHGVRVEGDSWAEMCRGRGVEAVAANELTLRDMMPVVNFKDNIYAHRTEKFNITGCYASASLSGVHGLRMYGCQNGVVQGNRFWDSAAAVDVLMRMDYCVNVAVNGNSFNLSTSTANPAYALRLSDAVNSVTSCNVTGNTFRLGAANAKGIYPEYAWLNTITGNVFRVTGASAQAFVMTAAGGTCNDICDNTGTIRSDTCRTSRVRNTSGVDIAVYNLAMWAVDLAGQTGADEVLLATAAAPARFAGVSAMGGLTNGATDVIQTEGRTNNAPVDGTTDVAIGDPLMIADVDADENKLVQATSTNLVVAIALEAYTTDSVAMKDVYILPPGQRYTLP